MPAVTPSVKSRLSAAGIHLTLSLAVAALAAWLVFGLWYPYPYREISGGRHLFLIVMAVDVIMGPLRTLAVFNRNKPTAELRRDFIQRRGVHTGFDGRSGVPVFAGKDRLTPRGNSTRTCRNHHQRSCM